MLKRLLLLSWASLSLSALPARAQAQVTLTNSPYLETFDGLNGGLPAGFSIYTNAAPARLGTPAPLTTAPTAWNNSSGAFKNFASATGLPATASSAEQAAAPNRALGLRQTGSFGDGTSMATPPTGVGPAFVFQIANTLGKTDFELAFRLQSLDNTIGRTATWQVEYGLGAAPGSFTTVGSTANTGPFFANTPIQIGFGGALDNQAGPVWIRIIAPNPTTGPGSRPSSAIDDFALSWNANPNAPALAVAPTTIDFGKQSINVPSEPRTFSLTGTRLTAPARVRTAAPFAVSKDGVVFDSVAVYSVAELAQPRLVYVRFTPGTLGQASGPVSGVATASSPGAGSRAVALRGTGNDPTQTVYDFNTCNGTTNLADGWIQFSVTGGQTWACTSFGRNPTDPTDAAPSPGAVQMNGFANGGNQANEDWLISPALNLTSTTFPQLSYWTRTAFNGPGLRLLVSTTYSGTGSPNAPGVTWTDLSASFPAQNSNVWQNYSLDLSGYKQGGVYVAFVYSSTTNGAARWSVDDVVLTNSAAPSAPTIRLSTQNLAFGYQPVNAPAFQNIVLTTTNLTGPLTITSTDAAFQLSKDSLVFSTSLTYSQAEASNRQLPVRVRFLPTQPAADYATTLSIATPNVPTLTPALRGNTYDASKTLEVVNWNLEWFGSTVAGQGPTDVELQQTNATTVFRALSADVYALQEIVDTLRLRNLTATLSAQSGLPYAYKIADFGSFGDNAADPDYAGTQKLAFVYRSDVVKPVLFQGLLRCTQAQNCPAFNAWSSGRFPYLMAADVTLDGRTQRVNFVNIHAKANFSASSANDYARRKAGAEQLKTLLETSYPGSNTLILGDFNDVLEGTIATGVTPAVSSYDTFVSDPNYVALTLPLARAGAQSTVGFGTVIDNAIATRQLASYYINGTAAIRTDLAAGVANYASTTTDHYPVFTRFLLTQTPTATTAATATAPLNLYPNPATSSLRFEVPETGRDLRLSVYTTTGRLVLEATGSAGQLNQQLSQRVASLSSGLYVVRIEGAKQAYVSRLQKL
ncbi:choice-of-anchor J domain-containing protein [Hymenobacter sp. ISL-91]|uniref:T9SS-dependent choice-of-anchor J family protein n=1 Tax=Hymenobacter sp. ISL-91 TaxID=2819151 RepID=UPI001BEAD521|nr:choice-of-anchor J domain-containing protein [Hymenobacter sp. ISL-91]MBT2558691.1 choice-of-anchor J domain-containing protein [Hymenobacter sp. ISL-91]